LPSKPSQWSKTSVPDSVKWNLSGGVAEAAVGEAIRRDRADAERDEELAHPSSFD